MTPDKLVQLCARALNVKTDSLSDASGPGSVPRWDSLGTMALLVAVEEEFGVRLSLPIAARLKSIGDLRAALRAKGIANI